MRALLRIRAADVCAPAGFFIRPEKRMNVVRDDKRRVHVEYMNTRAAFIYTYLVFHVVEYTAAGIFLACLSLSLSRSSERDRDLAPATRTALSSRRERFSWRRNRAAIRGIVRRSRTRCSSRREDFCRQKSESRENHLAVTILKYILIIVQEDAIVVAARRVSPIAE